MKVVILAGDLKQEYVSNINIRTMKRPLVVEEERYNL